MNINKFILENDNVRLTLLNVGAAIYDFEVKHNNSFKSYVLKYDDIEVYRDSPGYIGMSCCGRTAGRIENANFSLNGTNYQIDKNFLDKHNLHGGLHGLDKHFFDISSKSEDTITLTTISAEHDYPGNLKITVSFTLTEFGFIQKINAVSDKDTIFNPTNHTYFTLEQDENVLQYKMNIPTDYVYYLNSESIPVEKVSIDDSIFKGIHTGLTLNELKTNHQQFDYVKFIDHPFHLQSNIIEVSNHTHKLKITTNQDFLVIYTGNYLDEVNKTINNKMPFVHQGICLETQHAPNAINLEEHKNSVILKAGETYNYETTYEIL